MTVRERLGIGKMRLMLQGADGKMHEVEREGPEAVLADAIDAEFAEIGARVEALEARARGSENVGPGWVRLRRAAEIWGCSRATLCRDVVDGVIPEVDPDTGDPVWQMLRGRRVYSEAWLERHKGQRRGA